MKLPFSLYIALKYLRPKRSFLSVVTVLSVLGVLLGVAVLIVVLSVMNGFDEMWRDKILGFNAHLTIMDYPTLEADKEWIRGLDRIEGVLGAAPFIQGLAFLNHNDAVFSPFLRGIDPDLEKKISQVPLHMLEGAFSVEDEGLLLGADLAARMGVRVGDVVLVSSPQSFAKADALRLPEEMTVRGIFRLDMFDFDVGYALCSLSSARSLFGVPSGVHGVQVMTDDPERAPFTKQRLAEALGPRYDIRTWMEMNRPLFAQLRVEKNVMFFLLIIITVVAAFGITNTLITVAVQKTREIGLLKALGFSSGSVMRVFFWQSWIAGLLGTVSGIGTGLLILKYRNEMMDFMNRRLGMELLPKEFYRLSEIPSSTSAGDIAVVALTVMLICTLAGIIPAYRAARLDPARALRYE